MGKDCHPLTGGRNDHVRAIGIAEPNSAESSIAVGSGAEDDIRARDDLTIESADALPRLVDEMKELPDLLDSELGIDIHLVGNKTHSQVFWSAKCSANSGAAKGENQDENSKKGGAAGVFHLGVPVVNRTVGSVKSLSRNYRRQKDASIDLDQVKPFLLCTKARSAPPVSWPQRHYYRIEA